MNSLPSPSSSRFPGETPFSYDCMRCKRCCHDKLIQVNPYETARMARRLGLSTSQFIQTYLEEGVYLRRVDEGACVFLGTSGCGVHADRPLVCRLYPLGRHVGGGEKVAYSRVVPHPQSEGHYGQEGTAAGFIEAQGAAPFITAADLYLDLLSALLAVWRKQAPASEAENTTPDRVDTEPPSFSDMDVAIAQYSATQGTEEPQDIDARMQLHILTIRKWIAEAS